MNLKSEVYTTHTFSAHLKFLTWLMVVKTNEMSKIICDQLFDYILLSFPKLLI